MRKWRLKATPRFFSLQSSSMGVESAVPSNWMEMTSGFKLVQVLEGTEEYLKVVADWNIVSPIVKWDPFTNHWSVFFVNDTSIKEKAEKNCIANTAGAEDELESSWFAHWMNPSRSLLHPMTTALNLVKRYFRENLHRSYDKRCIANRKPTLGKFADHKSNRSPPFTDFGEKISHYRSLRFIKGIYIIWLHYQIYAFYHLQEATPRNLISP